jgi:hypothetical protein
MDWFVQLLHSYVSVTRGELAVETITYEETQNILLGKTSSKLSI